MSRLSFFDSKPAFEELLVQARIKAHQTPQTRFLQYKTDDRVTVNWFKDSKHGTIYVDGDALAAQAVRERLAEELTKRDSEMPDRPIKMAIEHLEYFSFVCVRNQGAVADMTSDLFPVGIRIEQFPGSMIRISSILDARSDREEDLKAAVQIMFSKLENAKVALSEGPTVHIFACYVGEYDMHKFASFLVKWWREASVAMSRLKEWDFIARPKLQSQVKKPSRMAVNLDGRT